MRKVHFGRRALIFGFVLAVSLMLSALPYSRLMRIPEGTEFYGHIPVIVLAFIALLAIHRKEAFVNYRSDGVRRHTMLAAGLFSWILLFLIAPPEADLFAAVSALSSLLIIWGGYRSLFGGNKSNRVIFPFVFLFLAIPLPLFIMHGIVKLLTLGSVFMTRVIFDMLRVPLVQEGPIFLLPGFYIEVARECSGIRSSLALMVTTVIASHLFLRDLKKQLILVLCVLPVAIFKNAMRIIALYLLSYFIDMRIIEGGYLHRSGGFIFFGLGIVILGGILWILQRGEAESTGQD